MPMGCQGFHVIPSDSLRIPWSTKDSMKDSIRGFHDFWKDANTLEHKIEPWFVVKASTNQIPVQQKHFFVIDCSIAAADQMVTLVTVASLFTFSKFLAFLLTCIFANLCLQRHEVDWARHEAKLLSFSIEIASCLHLVKVWVYHC